ncbi:MAG: prophage regulatory protein [Cocleimonas sp.]|jgi:prophage regulatory protein
MKQSEYEMVSNQLAHIKSTTEGAIRALELNLKYINTIESQLKVSVDSRLLNRTLTQPSLSRPDPVKQPSDLIKIKEVMQMTSLSRSTIYTKINQADFPNSISLSSRSVAWVRKEVENWISMKISG